MKDMKDPAIFIVKVVLGVVVGLMVYNWLKTTMEAKKAPIASPALAPAVTETVAA